MTAAAWALAAVAVVVLAIVTSRGCAAGVAYGCATVAVVACAVISFTHHLEDRRDRR